MNQPHFSFTLPAPAPRRNFGSKALWLIGIGLMVNAAILLRGQSAQELFLDQKALAQAQVASPSQPLGARGLFMMPAQLGSNTYGLYLMDVDSGTIVVYKAVPETSHFRLMAARSFKYDRFLEDFNNDPLRPKDVQKLVEDQQQRRTLQDKDGVPTVEQAPKPDENLPTTVPGVIVPR